MKKDEFSKILESNSDTLLIDIREAEELGHSESLAGTQHIPMGKMFTEAVKDNLPKDKKMVVFCRTGVRAEIVARELRRRGYDIDGLEGGLNAFNN